MEIVEPDYIKYKIYIKNNNQYNKNEVENLKESILCEIKSDIDSWLWYDKPMNLNLEYEDTSKDLLIIASM